jgi:site-specific DNA recombinase
MNNRAALYVRVSTDEQTLGYSLDAQEDELRKYANEQNYEIYDLYKDGGFSGKDFNRPDIQRLIQDAEEDKIDTILVWKIDRLSRNNADVLSLIDNVLKPRDKNIVITQGNINSATNHGYMFISLFSTWAHFERANIIERVSMGMNKRAAMGEWNGGSILGYCSEDKKLKVCSREKEIVQEIFNLRAQGLGYKAIVNIMNDKGVRTKRGKDFSIAGVKSILSNQVYIGKIVWGKYRQWSSKRRAGKKEPIIIDGIHEPIIDINLWNRVQEINEIHNKTFSNNRNFNGNFFLTGILKCPQCNSGMVMSKSKKYKQPGYHLYYMCQGYHSKGKSYCSSNLIKKEYIEEKLISIIAKLITDIDLVRDIFTEINRGASYKREQAEESLQRIKTEQKKVSTQLNKVDNDYMTEKIDIDSYQRIIGILMERKKKYDDKQKKTETLLSKAPVIIEENQVVEMLMNFTELFETAANEEKKLLIRALIKEINMNKDRKGIKDITFWFSPAKSYLPSDKTGRTVS